MICCGAGWLSPSHGPIFQHYDPAQPFIWHFADESYAAKLAVETLIGRLAALFAALAIMLIALR
jgi:putative ABC transport system permease protein